MRTPARGWALPMAGESSGDRRDAPRPGPSASVQRNGPAWDGTTMLTPITDTDVHVATRTAWHTLAERVLAPARHTATGHIGLRPAPGGFTTGDLGDGRSIAVAGAELVVANTSGARRAPISTLGAAATFV